jgi:hypothetical protein
VLFQARIAVILVPANTAFSPALQPWLGHFRLLVDCLVTPGW